MPASTTAKRTSVRGSHIQQLRSDGSDRLLYSTALQYKYTTNEPLQAPIRRTFTSDSSIMLYTSNRAHHVRFPNDPRGLVRPRPLRFAIYRANSADTV
jgi:hypothetical protein